MSCSLLLRCVAVLALGAHQIGGLTITMAHGSATELRTKDQLQRLVALYHLDAWAFTRAVTIDDSAIPHSHPTLTLHTRHLKDDDLLVSTFVHEELHWFLAQHQAATDSAIQDLRQIFPSIPLGFPEGSSDDEGNYVHVLVNWLEYRVDRNLLGELRARSVMEFWAQDHYTWIYRAVLEHGRDIGGVIRRHSLLPPPTNEGP